FDPRRERHRLRDLPRPGRQDAADRASRAADDAVVPGLPSRSGEEPATAQRSFQHDLARQEPARIGRTAHARIPHRQAATDGLFRMSSVTPFDMDAERARLQDVRGPKLWRSLEELADSEGFRAWLRREHPQLADMAPVDRRGFLKIVGASLTLAGLGACSRPPQTELVPYVHGQVGQVGGLPRYFATVLTRNGYAQGVL